MKARAVFLDKVCHGDEALTLLRHGSGGYAPVLMCHGDGGVDTLCGGGGYAPVLRQSSASPAELAQAHNLRPRISIHVGGGSTGRVTGEVLTRSLRCVLAKKAEGK